MNRLGHVLLGAFILGAFFAMSIAAYYILKKRHLTFAKKTFTIALVVAVVASLVQLISGHDHSLFTDVESLPELLASGHWRSTWPCASWTSSWRN